MEVHLLSETGWDVVVRAARLSRRSLELSDTVLDELGPVDITFLHRLVREDDSGLGDPHAVALRMVQYTFQIKAPLYWWKQMDRYAVGKTQASDSTMYNLLKRELIPADFTANVDKSTIATVNRYIRERDFYGAVANLPSGYQQERIVQMSFTTLRRIIYQRLDHKLPEWHFFIEMALRQVKYRALLWT